MSSGLLVTFLNLDSRTLKIVKAHVWLAVGPACLVHTEQAGLKSYRDSLGHTVLSPGLVRKGVV